MMWVEHRVIFHNIRDDTSQAVEEWLMPGRRNPDAS